MPTSTRSSKRQTKLGFSPVGSSSPAASKLSKDVRHRAAAVTFEGSPTKKRKVAPVWTASQESDSEEEEEEAEVVQKSLPTPSKSSQPSAQKIRSSRRKQQGKLDFTNHIGGTIERTPSPEGTKKRTPRSTGKRKGVFRKAKAVVELSSSSDEAEEIQVKSAKKRGTSRNGLSSFVEEESSGDEPMRSSSTKKPRRLMRRKERASSFVNDEEDEEDEDEDDPIPASARKRRIQRKPAPVEDDGSNSGQDDDDEDDDIVSTQRRRPPETPSRKVDQQEQDDLAEDLDFLQSSPPPPRSGKLRSSAPPKMTAKQKALEALKRRRQGAAVSSSLDSEDEEDAEEGDDQFVEDDGPQTLEAVEEEEVEDDFVIEDDEKDTLGAPAQLPLMFSAQSRMKPKELFKYIVEWMVQKKINPAFDSQDEIYGLAFSRVDDETAALSTSKFKSSVWKRDFTVAVSARPQIVIHEFGLDERDLLGGTGCEACGRTTHPATFRILFDGKPYQKSTLEDIDNGDSDDSDSDTGPERDALGRDVPPTTRSWAVGVFCKTNAETAHTLEHWRYHLNE